MSVCDVPYTFQRKFMRAMGEEIYDVVVVGGGPAGSCAAIHLAMRGARVLLAEQKKFPREKLCGEFVSPECLGHFARLGVLKGMEAAGGREVLETVFYARSGRGVAVPSCWFAGAESWRGGAALGLSRAEMDERLLERAREVGVEVREETQAVGLLRTREGVGGVRLRASGDASGNDVNAQRVRARVTIDATGRAHVLARLHEREARGDARGKRKRRSVQRAALVAFKAHLEGVRGDERTCEIYFYRGGYGGLSPVEGGRSNLCFIARARDVRACASDPARVMREVVQTNLRAARTLAGARLASEWLSVAIESFGRRELAPAAGLLAVGDAASFIDPFTGSGMLMALESGELAADVIARHLPGLRVAQSNCEEADEAGAIRDRSVSLTDEPRGLFLTHQTAASLTEDENAASICNALADDAYEALADEYRSVYEARFGGRLRVCSWLRRAALAPPSMAEVFVAALKASTGARRALARATRHHARQEFPAKL